LSLYLTYGGNAVEVEGRWKCTKDDNMEEGRGKYMRKNKVAGGGEDARV